MEIRKIDYRLAQVKMSGVNREGVVFRQATKEDLELLVQTRVEVLKAANKLPMDTDMEKDMEKVEKESRAYFEKGFAEGSFLAYFAMAGDQVAGTGGVSFYQVMPTYHNPSGVRAYIMNMYTHPAYRRRGIRDYCSGQLSTLAGAEGAGQNIGPLYSFLL